MRTLFTYIMVFPRRSAFVLFALLIAGIAEGLSLTALLPLLSIAVGESGQTGESSGIGKFMEKTLQDIGIEPTLDTILIIIVGGMFFKGLVLLLANRQVGYTVAHVATALRLDLIEALKLGCDIEINVDADFQDEVKRIFTENIGWLENDLSFDRIELKEMMSQSNGKEINYIQRLVDLAVASPQNLTINQEMTLLEFVETEKAIINYNKSKK